MVPQRTESRSAPRGRKLRGGNRVTDDPGESMTGRTTPTTAPPHGLTVLQGGLSEPSGRELLDEQLAIMDADWLAREIEEASRLCDALEAAGNRVAFSLHGNGERGLQVAVRELLGDELVRELDARDVLDPARLLQLDGLGG